MATAKKAAAKKPAAKKPAAKTAAVKKAPAAKKPAAKAPAAPAAPAKKAAVKKAAPAKKAAVKKAPAAVAKAPAAKKPVVAKAARKPNAAFMKELKPSAQLAAVIGDKPVPRTEVIKKLWEYIKKFKLQDPVNKRMINADEKLKQVFGQPQVSMFELTKVVGKHLS